jgi:diacylglycerol kinase
MPDLRLKKSYLNAIHGLYDLVKDEENIKIHSIVALVVIGAIIYFNLNRVEAAIILILTLLVFITEIANTALEKMLDRVHPEKHPEIGKIKDALAGMVLVTVFVAVIIGVAIFLPHFDSLLNIVVGIILFSITIIVVLLSALI